MNDKHILRKDHLLPFLRKLAKSYKLVAPVRNDHGDLFLEPVASVEKARFDFAGQAQMSAKPFFFPQRDLLFRYQRTAAEGYCFEPAINEEPTLFFGLRSCDLSALLYMDVVFLRNGKDIYYLKRRESSVLVTIACNSPFPNCFCNTSKSGPFLEYGYDLQLTDLGDRYFVEPGRIKGEGLIRRWPHFFAPASQEDSKAQYQVWLEARSGFQRQVHLDTAIKKLAAGEVDDTLWAQISARCQDCGGCSFVCPTCTCFSITDQAVDADHGLRVRTWDACTFSGFSRMAGGHNPVASDKARLKRRFMHKLCYDFQQHGRPSCVGCGRCVGICFGAIDMIRFVDLVCGHGAAVGRRPERTGEVKP